MGFLILLCHAHWGQIPMGCSCREREKGSVAEKEKDREKERERERDIDRREESGERREEERRGEEKRREEKRREEKRIEEKRERGGGGGGHECICNVVYRMEDTYCFISALLDVGVPGARLDLARRI